MSTNQRVPPPGAAVRYSNRFLGLERAEVKLPTVEQWAAWRRRVDALDSREARAAESAKLLADLGLKLDAAESDLVLRQLTDLSIESCRQSGRQLVMEGRALGLPVRAVLEIPKLAELQAVEADDGDSVLRFARARMVGAGEGWEGGKPPPWHLHQLGLKLYVETLGLIEDTEVFFSPAGGPDGNGPAASAPAGSPPSSAAAPAESAEASRPATADAGKP